MVKTYILDTNVLLHDPKSLFSFQDNEVVLSLTILEELDKKKSGPDEVARNAREVIRSLDGLRSSGNISKGVATKDGGLIRIEINHKDSMPAELDPSRADNRIISVAIGLAKEGKNVILITKDINLRVKCDALGVVSEDYKTDYVAEKAEEVYSGFAELEISTDLLEEFQTQNSIPVVGSGFYENQYVLLKTNKNKKNSLAKVSDGLFVPIQYKKDIWGINPKNREQTCALDALFDPEIKLVTLLGKSGCGKTLLAVLAGISQVLDEHQYKKLILTRPVEPLGGRGKESQDIGFLPGTMLEKMMPILMPYFDNLDLLFGDKGKNMVEQYIDDGIISIEALSYIRGRSLNGPALIIVDECQNLSPKAIKTILTRVGFGSKIILTGDIFQIDSIYLDSMNNGLSYVIEKFKGQKIASTITFSKGERSELATLSSQIL
jgi:PhoH-like ATPase